jgi:hypothetical protein
VRATYTGGDGTQQPQAEGAIGRRMFRPQSTQRSGGLTSHGNRFRFAAWNFWFQAVSFGNYGCGKGGTRAPREPAEAKKKRKNSALYAKCGGGENRRRRNGSESAGLGFPRAKQQAGCQRSCKTTSRLSAIVHVQNSKQVVNLGSSPIPHPHVCLLKVTSFTTSPAWTANPRPPRYRN